MTPVVLSCLPLLAVIIAFTVVIRVRFDGHATDPVRPGRHTLKCWLGAVGDLVYALDLLACPGILAWALQTRLLRG